MKLTLIARSKDWSTAFPVYAAMAPTIEAALNAAEPPAPAGADEDPWKIITTEFGIEETEIVMAEVTHL
jgi:hypothetical protein